MLRLACCVLLALTLLPGGAWAQGESTRYYQTESPLKDGTHDPESAATRMLQDPHEVLPTLPKDRLGQVDWVKALNEGLIHPRKSVRGGGKLRELDTDVIMQNTAAMPYVRFPHKAHTRWLACSNCHNKIFLPKAGANRITMDEVMQGKYCGICHGTVAFSWVICERCHDVPHGGMSAWWKK